MTNKLFLKFTVDNMKLTRNNYPQLTEGSNKYIYATFKFSQDWSGLDKYLLVSRANQTYPILIENDIAEIEYEAIRTAGYFDIGVIGSKGDTVITTNPLSILVTSTEFKDNPSGAETRLTNDFIIKSLQEIKANRDSVDDTVEQLPTIITNYIDSHKEELKGDNGKDGKDGIDGQDGYTPIKGIDYFDGQDGRNGIDGYTPVKNVDYFDGKDGRDGVDGKDGKDGEVPAEQLAQIEANRQAITQQSEEITTLRNQIPTDNHIENLIKAKTITLTQAEYDALEVKSSDTTYLVLESD